MNTTGAAAWLLALTLACLCLPGAADADAGDNPWALLTQRLVMTDCEPGEAGDHWARHYVGHPVYLADAIDRVRPWLAFVVDQIVRRELPGELALLPIVESGYDPFAYSHRRAAGSWQLLAETAALSGLTVNEWYDGRHDMYAATPAALDYLQALHRQLNHRWELAIAAYNAGPGRVTRSLHTTTGNQTQPAWQTLSLPGETRVYLSRIQGLSCLFADPDRYGYRLPTESVDDGFAIIALPGPTDVVAISTAAGIDPARLLQLNAGLKRHFTPPDGPHYLVVPAEAEGRARTAAAAIAPASTMVWAEINSRRGDSLTGIARRHDASPLALKQINQLEDYQPRIGQRLLIPSAHSRPDDPEYAIHFRRLTELQQQLLPDHRYRHRVRSGESLWVLSQRYSVSAEAIRRSNGLSANARIRPGQYLEIPPGALSLKPHEYRIQPGDNLWTIARMYGVSVNDLVHWNGLRADQMLKPGLVLVIGNEGCCNTLGSFPAL